jgi:hypothetical protein
MEAENNHRPTKPMTPALFPNEEAHVYFECSCGSPFCQWVGPAKLHRIDTSADGPDAMSVTFQKEEHP